MPKEFIFLKNSKDYTSFKSVTADIPVKDKDVKKFMSEEVEACHLEIDLLIIDHTCPGIAEDIHTILYKGGLSNSENEIMLIELIMQFHNAALSACQDKNKQFVEYWKSVRKFDVRSLVDKKLDTFNNNFMYSPNDPAKVRLKRILDAIHLDSTIAVQESIIETLYHDKTALIIKRDLPYSDECIEILEKFGELLEIHIPLKTPAMEFTNIFVKEFEGYLTTKLRVEAYLRILREGEEFTREFWELFYLHVLQNVLREKNIAKNQLFAFSSMYLRQPFLFYLAPATEKEFIDFWHSIKKSLQDLLVCVLFSGNYDQNKITKLIILFIKEFQKYLKFYPVWLEIIRDDDKNRKHENFLSRNEQAFSEIIEEGTEFLHSAGMIDIKEDSLLRDIIQSEPNIYRHMNLVDLENFMNKNLTQKQLEVILMRVNDMMTENEIAVKLNITQSAVSQRLSSAKTILTKFLKS